MIKSTRKFLGSATLVAVLTLAMGAHVRADSAAVAMSPGSGYDGNNGNDVGYSLGYTFTANSNITVTQLGYYDDSTLTESHEVGLYNSSGTLLASTIVTNADTLIVNFKYNAITPVTLTAGQNYEIMALAGKVDHYVVNPTTFSTDPSITYVEDNFAISATLKFTKFSDGNLGYFGPNFLINSAAVVPEPSTLVLGGLALMGGLSVASRRRLARAD